MGIRAADQYKEGLQDGRRVFIRGDKVEDITAPPRCASVVRSLLIQFMPKR
jgi:aromatic ring hydroxylase